MAVILGKRKRQENNHPSPKNRQQPIRDPSPPAESDVLQNVFRRAFEAQFRPLAIEAQPVANVTENTWQSSGEEEDSDWEGISDEEDGVDVVEHSFNSTVDGERMSKSERRAFMSTKPPLSSKQLVLKHREGVAVHQDDPDTQHFKDDLALEKLLRESHLLSKETASTVTTGSTRHKATDLHLQKLGSKRSILTQVRMPMSHRKGIATKTAEREEKRRRDAKENGIILENVAKVKNKRVARARGVGLPTVGRFKGGTLRLSQKDVAQIEGSKRMNSAKRGKARSSKR